MTASAAAQTSFSAIPAILVRAWRRRLTSLQGAAISEGNARRGPPAARRPPRSRGLTRSDQVSVKGETHTLEEASPSAPFGVVRIVGDVHALPGGFSCRPDRVSECVDVGRPPVQAWIHEVEVDRVSP